MKFLESQEILERTKDIIHEGTQLHDRHIDLTVSEIHRLEDAGSLDFGGSEFTPVGSEIIHPEKKNPNDDYGWWDLKIDTYKAVLNESVDLNEDVTAIITPHINAAKAGLDCNTRFITSEDDLNPMVLHFHVPVAGCKIKQNARIATLHFIRL